MILFPAELVAQVVTELPTDIRNLVESHYLDGTSVFKIQRQTGMKRRDLESILAATLETMRTALRRRGIHSVLDVM